MTLSQFKCIMLSHSGQHFIVCALPVVTIFDVALTVKPCAGCPRILLISVIAFLWQITQLHYCSSGSSTARVKSHTICYQVNCSIVLLCPWFQFRNTYTRMKVGISIIKHIVYQHNSCQPEGWPPLASRVWICSSVIGSSVPAITYWLHGDS